jgi:hypothetical protein
MKVVGWAIVALMVAFGAATAWVAEAMRKQAGPSKSSRRSGGGALRGTRTPDPQVRSLMLYPTELGAPFLFYLAKLIEVDS